MQRSVQAMSGSTGEIEQVSATSPGSEVNFLEAIAENIQEIIWMYDSVAKCVRYVNPAYERIFGRSPDSVYTNPASWREALHEDDRDLIEAKRHPFADEGTLEFRIVRPDGEVRWLWSHAESLRDEGGSRLGIVGVAEDITERKRAEQALETSVSLLRATLESTADGILVVDLEGQVAGYNRRFLELWKIPDFIAERAGDAELLDYVANQVADPDGFMREVRQIYADPNIESFDRVTFRDGRVYERYSRPQRLASEVVGRVWSFRDVSARVHAEAALRQRNHRLDVHNQALLRLAQQRVRPGADLRVALAEITERAAQMLNVERVGIWQFDEMHSQIRSTDQYTRSRHAHADGAILSRADYPAYFEAIELERSLPVVDARTDPRTREFRESYLEPHGITSMLDAPIRAGGRMLGVVCFEQVGLPQRKWSAEDRAFAASIGDLVSLALESAELQRSEENVRFLLDVSRSLAESLDLKTTLTRVARLAVPGFADWCMVTLLEDGVLQRVAMAHSQPDKEGILQDLQRRYPASTPSHPAMRAIRTGQAELVSPVTEEMLRERTIDEGHRELIRKIGLKSYMVIPLIAHDTTLGAIVFASINRCSDANDLELAKDIASRAAVAIDNARLHERVHAASKAKSSFLAVMSHELRTPLSAITGYADLLEAGIPDPLTDKQKKQVSRIKLRAYDLLRVIEEILAFSRLQTGDERFHYEDVDVAAIVRDVGAVAQSMAREHGLTVNLSAPEQPATVRTDPTKLRQLLVDLISNAVKFTAQGTIGLEGFVSNGTAGFRVKDTGIGIAPEYLEKIFEPFFQVEELNTREKGGTGIGLAVARGLARLLGGDVTVDSEPGRGSTFTVTLPSHPVELIA